MIAVTWVRGLLRRRPVDMVGAMVAAALAVGFLAALGTFVGVDRAHLTARASRGVAVDWQVQSTPGAAPGAVLGAVRRVPHLRYAASVDFAAVSGFASAAGGSRHETGRGYVVGLAPGYASEFPSVLRPLVGSMTGAVLLQQTAANLAAAPGEKITVRATTVGRQVVVTGVVDMPQEDSFFQTVGAAAGAGPSAPPDNVLLVPASEFARLTAGAPVAHQVHVELSHRWLPSDPARAAAADSSARNHLEAALAGSGLVGDNLGASLLAAREDALYGQLLFLLLGLPAFAVALVVVALVVQVRGQRRVRDYALLRLRGARVRELAAAAAGETATVVTAGVALGWPVGAAAAGWAFGRTSLSVPWFLIAAGSVLSVLTGLQVLALRQVTRRGADPLPGLRGSEAAETGRPWPLRFGLDLVLLAASGLVFWLVARGGYQVVLVPEGVPSTSVDWAALLAPALAWPGLALLWWRLVDSAVGHLPATSSKDGGELVIAALRRRRRVVARAAVVLAVALAVAGSTAVFTATYRVQSRLDVALTVGSDVAVQLPADAAAANALAASARHAPGVGAISAQTHRFAYVGSDLQDFYGIDPTTIRAATPLQDAFVPGSTIGAALAGLHTHPNGVLLSAETLHDYQLHPGDPIRLRLQTSHTRGYTPVPFTVVGEVAEWPTAPKDSFIIANAAYVAKVTGTPGTTTLLLSSSSPAGTANWVRRHSAGAAAVTDVTSARQSVSTASGLAATDLGGLARLELGYGVLLAVAAFGLALLVGVMQRRRALVVLAALGASARQRGRFLATEAGAILVGGVLGGAAITAAVAALLVKVLTGIFDPPPQHPAVPWAYLGLLFALVLATAVVVIAAAGRAASRAGPSELRDL